MFAFKSKIPHRIIDEDEGLPGTLSSMASHRRSGDLSQLSEERTTIVDIPIVTPEKPKMIIFDKPPVYDNVPQDNFITDPLDTSLHTISSDVSINLNLEFESEAAVADDEDLSLRASQLDSSELQASNVINAIPDDSPEGIDDKLAIPASASHDFETLVNVSQLLLKTDEEAGGETQGRAPFCVRIMGKIAGSFVLLGMVAGGLSFWIEMIRREQEANSMPPIREDENSLTVGTITYQKETLEMDVALSFGTLLHLVFVGIATRIALQAFKNAGSTFLTSEPTVDDVSASCRGSQGEEDNGDNDSVPSLISVPSDFEDEVLSTYDLSKYRLVKTTKIQALLLSRNCSQTGSKVELMYRLVSAYHKQLHGMTVVQLRQRLKKGNMKQVGRKDELIRRLVEAGFESQK